jgi:hypothetical protein
MPAGDAHWPTVLESQPESRRAAVTTMLCVCVCVCATVTVTVSVPQAGSGGAKHHHNRHCNVDSALRLPRREISTACEPTGITNFDREGLAAHGNTDSEPAAAVPVRPRSCDQLEAGAYQRVRQDPKETLMPRASQSRWYHWQWCRRICRPWPCYGLAMGSVTVRHCQWHRFSVRVHCSIDLRWSQPG